MRNTVYKEGALDLRAKELISIAASVACAMFVAARSQLSWSDVYDRLLNNK